MKIVWVLFLHYFYIWEREVEPIHAFDFYLSRMPKKNNYATDTFIVETNEREDNINLFRFVSVFFFARSQALFSP